MLRFPDGMRDRIAELAKENGRSMNAEIITRLEWALSVVGPPEKKTSTLITQPVGGALTWLITSEIKDLADQGTISFDEMFAKIVLAGLHREAPEVVYLPVLPGATREDVRTALQATKGMIRPDATSMIENLSKAPWAPAWMIELMKAKRPDILAKVVGQETDVEADIVVTHGDGNVTIVETKKQDDRSKGAATPAVRRHKRSASPKKTSA